MSLSKEEMEEILSTEIVSLWNKELKWDIIDKRRTMIEEAVGWEKGPSRERPEKHVVHRLNDDIEVYFLKPGKETDRVEGNPNDMTPRVGDHYNNYTFDDAWTDIADLSVIDYDLFKLSLIIIYRDGYLLDHEYIDDDKKKVRYSPDEDISACIDTIDKLFEEELPDGGLWGFLHFIDILGWNEDVKYHSEESPYEYEMEHGDFNTGRINNFLSTIKVPYLLASFVHQVIEKADEPEEIDFSKGLETAQNLTVGRGVCPASQTELERWFSPIMYK